MRSKINEDPLRIFIGPCEVAGQYRNLAISLRKQNIDCDYYSFYHHPFDYGSDLGSSKIPSWMRQINLYGKSGSLIKRILAVVL